MIKYIVGLVKLSLQKDIEEIQARDLKEREFLIKNIKFLIDDHYKEFSRHINEVNGAQKKYIDSLISEHATLIRKREKLQLNIDKLNSEILILESKHSALEKMKDSFKNV